MSRLFALWSLLSIFDLCFSLFLDYSTLNLLLLHLLFFLHAVSNFTSTFHSSLTTSQQPLSYHIHCTALLFTIAFSIHTYTHSQSVYITNFFLSHWSRPSLWQFHAPHHHTPLPHVHTALPTCPHDSASSAASTTVVKSHQMPLHSISLYLQDFPPNLQFKNWFILSLWDLVCSRLNLH